MATQVDFRDVLGLDFAIARLERPPGYYVELELDPLERAAHRFFWDGWQSFPIVAARAFRDAVFEEVPEDWLDAVLAVYERLRGMTRGTGVRRTSTAGVGYWGILAVEEVPGRFPRRTYSEPRFGASGAKAMALFRRAQEVVRKLRPELLQTGAGAEDWS